MTRAKKEQAEATSLVVDQEAFRSIPLFLIDPSPWQRRHFSRQPDAEDLSLAASIGAVGVIEPIVVRPTGERYELVAGERRKRAAAAAGLLEIPAIVRQLTDDQAVTLTAVENLQRKDLAPLEEAASIELLLGRVGWGVEEVARETGRSPAWVSRRAQLTKLGAKWQKAIADPKKLYRLLGAGHLEVVARLPVASQDQVLQETHWLFDRGYALPTIARLSETIDRLVLRSLAKAPWKKDDADLVPAAGSCIACPKRTGAAPLLFDEMQPAKGDDLGNCCDPKCWDRKLEAHTTAVIAAAKEEHGEDLILIDEGHYSHNEKPPSYRKGALLQSYDRWPAAKPGAPGAMPVVYVGGDREGQTGWAKKPSKGGSRSGRGDGVVKALAERRKQLQIRRDKLAVERSLLALGDVPSESLPTIATMAALALAYGTKHRYESVNWCPPLDLRQFSDLAPPNERQETTAWGCLPGLSEDVVATLKARKKWPVTAAWGIFEAYSVLATEGPLNLSLVIGLWASFLQVLTSRCRYWPGADTAAQFAELRAVAELVKLDLAPIRTAADEELPEPKSWAGLKADGTLKKASKKKAKKTKPAPRKKAAK